MMNADDASNRKLRYYSHAITYENLNNFISEANDLHNLISCIFGMTELYLSYQRK